MTEPKLIHIRIEPGLVRNLDYLTVDYDLFRTDLIEMLLEEAYERVKSGDWDLNKIKEEFFTAD